MHVTRQRVARIRLGIFGARLRGRTRIVAAGSAALALAGSGIAYASTEGFGNHLVGTSYSQGLQLAGDQAIAPIGDRLLQNQGKLLSSTISPDGHHLAALTTDRSIALTIVDLDTYKIVQQAGTATTANLRIATNDVGQEGPTYSPDGRFLWMPQINGFDRFPVNADGTVSAPTFVPLPIAGAQHPLPAQAVFTSDGSTMYVAVNGQNTVVAMDPTTGVITRTWDVGNAPRELALYGDQLYVSDEGGRTAQAGEDTLSSYGTQVPADHYAGAVTTGAVSVIDTADPAAAVSTIRTGLHPTALHAADGALFVANTGSDTVS